MEDILKEIDFEKFNNSQNEKIREKLNKILQRKFKMDKIVEKNSGYDYDKNINNILIENLDSCVKDHITILRNIEFDLEDNLSYMKNIRKIRELFDDIEIKDNQSKNIIYLMIYCQFFLFFKFFLLNY